MFLLINKPEARINGQIKPANRKDLKKIENKQYF